MAENYHQKGCAMLGESLRSNHAGFVLGAVSFHAGRPFMREAGEIERSDEPYRDPRPVTANAYAGCPSCDIPGPSRV